tara:strand:- start:859 stop:1125 length:267 start_codon:yes stop_codon:yes gene_type:complete
LSGKEDEKLENEKTPHCAVCKLIRIYVLVAIPMIIIMWTKPEITRLQGISLTNAAALLIAVSFAAMVSWKYYIEFWKPRREADNKKRT